MEITDLILRIVMIITIPATLTGIFISLKEIVKEGFGGENMAIRVGGKIVYTDEIPAGVSIGMKDGTIIVGVKEIDRPVAATTEATQKII